MKPQYGIFASFQKILLSNLDSSSLNKLSFDLTTATNEQNCDESLQSETESINLFVSVSFLSNRSDTKQTFVKHTRIIVHNQMNIHSSVTDPSGYTHRWVLDFELAFFNKDFYSSVENWMTEWWWISIPYAVAYIILVFLGRAIMEKREKFQLRFPLFLWNLSLTVFSCWGAIRTVPEVFYIVKHHGFRSSLCDPIFKEGITGFW